MNTTETPPVTETLDPKLNDAVPENLDNVELKINGFDQGNKSTLKEPSLYLSIVIMFVTSFVCLGKTPVIFWATFAALTAVVIGIHIGAERFLFKSRPEHKVFAAPFEGIFVVTFGAILPGLALLAYGVYAIATGHNLNIGEEIGKVALLLFVPLSNFLCWSAIRRGYLVRPRLIGLMTGFALGLSAVWTGILLKTIFDGHADAACKFGWMLLLCTSPFLLFAAISLSLDLWNKTDKNIQRITTTFSFVGILLSAAFLFTPVARVLWVQSLIDNAKVASNDDKSKALANLREVASDQDLRPSKYSVNGFALASLLVPNRGLTGNSEQDRRLYFETTGDSIFSDPDKKTNTDSGSKNTNTSSSVKVPGLSLGKSQMAGTIDATTYSSSIDWTMTLKNKYDQPQEAVCEIVVPKNAVVSRATLWVNNIPQEAAFASTGVVRAAYRSETVQRKDPLLVTMPTADHVLVQCSPIAANTGEMQIRLGFKLPLQPIDGQRCALELPRILNCNFELPKRQRINFHSQDKIVRSIPGIDTIKDGDGYALSGVIKDQDTSKVNALIVQRTAREGDVVVPDLYAAKPTYIIERLKEVITPSTRRLAVVIDTSASLKPDVEDLKKALQTIPASFDARVYFADGSTETANSKTQNEAASVDVKQALKRLETESFVGGHENLQTLRDAMENTAEAANGAVLWIHGPQPVASDNEQTLDLMHRVSLYDVQLKDGANTVLPRFQTADLSGVVATERIKHQSTFADLKTLISQLAQNQKNLAVHMTSANTLPKGNLVDDRLASAQVSSLWAKEEIGRLLANGNAREALTMGANYRVISPISGAVVLDGAKAYERNGLKAPNYIAAGAIHGVPVEYHGGGGGLVGAPVDPAFGQRNEVGMLADYGYDTARNIARLATLASIILSIIIVAFYLRGRKEKTRSVLLKATVTLFAIPVLVQFMGTFMINNFGGLGGGL